MEAVKTTALKIQCVFKQTFFLLLLLLVLWKEKSN